MLNFSLHNRPWRAAASNAHSQEVKNYIAALSEKADLILDCFPCVFLVGNEKHAAQQGLDQQAFPYHGDHGVGERITGIALLLDFVEDEKCTMDPTKASPDSLTSISWEWNRWFHRICFDDGTTAGIDSFRQVERSRGGAGHQTSLATQPCDKESP